MTFLVERLAELRKHLAHLRELRPRAANAASLSEDLSEYVALDLDCAVEALNRLEPIEDFLSVVARLIEKTDRQPG